MASPSTVLTRGYGSWGTVNELPTLGYGIGASVALIPSITFRATRYPKFVASRYPSFRATRYPKFRAGEGKK